MAEEHLPAPRRAPRSWVVAVWVIMAGLALIAATSVFLHYSKLALFLAGECREHKVSEIPSPDGKLKVVLYTRDCGATTRASTHLSVLGIDAKPPGRASAEVFEGYEYPWDGVTHKIAAKWTESGSLVVTYTDDVELTHLNNQVGRVHVRFELRR